MLTLLKALDPVVYEWWVHGRNRTPHFAQGIIDANLSEHWFALQGWIPFGDRYGSFDDSGVPHIHVDKSLTAFEVVEAIVSEARTGNLMQHGVNFRVGFIYQQTRLD